MMSFDVSMHSTMIGLRAGAASRMSSASPRVATVPFTSSTALSCGTVDWLMRTAAPPPFGVMDDTVDVTNLSAPSSLLMRTGRAADPLTACPSGSCDSAP